MASRSDSAGSVRPRARRSIAHVPRSKLTSAIDKENSTTDVGAIQPHDTSAKSAGKDKRSRSKSLGPGGLDALQSSNGNRRKSTAAFPLKSILKATAPVSPVRNIPSFEETRKQTPARGSQQKRGSNQDKQGLLIDFDTPARPSGSDTENLTNPFDDFNAASEIAAAREREEKEQRERERKAAIEQRDARRKSLANRRVSFAPEATLHTWNVVEIPDDSTSSSTSNSTRRASSTANTERKEPEKGPDQNELPSSPDVEVDPDIAFSPVQYPDLQSLANRPATSGGYGDSHVFSSSPFSGSSVDGSEDTGIQSVARDDDDEDDSGSDAGFDAESTAMSMDDMTAQSNATARTDGSDASTNTSSSTRLNEALRQAAQEAGTRGIDHDENDDMSMEIASQEITGAFQPWIKKGQRQSFDWDDLSARHDQENVNPSKQPTGNHVPQEPVDDDEDEDMSMDVTNAIGGILSKQPSRRQSTIRRQSSAADEEQTMEFTNVLGGIAQQASPAKSIGADSIANDDEEMTMEFTSVVGGVMNKNPPAFRQTDENDPQTESHTPRSEPRNFSEWNNEADDMDDGIDMEMTGAVGGILPPIEERTEPQDDDQTAGMDVTAAMGKILPSEIANDEEDDERTAMERELDFGPPGSSPFQEDVRTSPAKSPGAFHVATIAAENGSPSLASVRSRRTRSSLGRVTSNTPTPNSLQPSPPDEETTPSKQPTPRVSHPSTPEKTPLSGKKLFVPELQASARQNKSPLKGIFEHNAATGDSTPQFILRPQKRRSSGIGIDKEGLGSPRVAAMLDKRRSIGDEVPHFIPQEQPKQGGVRFEDPVKLQEEVDREREEEENREDGHIPPLQPSERGATSNLRDMISSLTPRKNKFRGRKSLHVGAASGLLGKRPKELDLSDDEEESDSTPKRLRGREASPVKNIRLPAHPTMDETVGRSARSPAPKLLDSPAKGSTTPTHEPRSENMGMSPVKGGSGSFNSATGYEPVDEEVVARDGPEPNLEPIQLQDFLNMTNIHFMELTTTKRRHTTVLGSASKKSARRSSGNQLKPASFEDCVAAGFCTVPMLELYQHSCRELKSYISEGRQVIRSIEAETYAENPPLFREYVTAAPDIRLLMDNQFRNVKTHVRLLSKATWYEWRMKLLDGLKEGLIRHIDEMKGDGEALSKYETLLDSVIPALVEKHSSLEQEATSLQELTDEMENCDQDELRAARKKVSGIEDEIELKKQELEEMQREVQDKTNTFEAGMELKTEFMAQIQEAERVKEECRGWSAKEINELRDSVHNIEIQTGWSIVSATSSSSVSAGPSLTMSYRKQLRLMFHPAAFYLGNTSKKPESMAGAVMNMPLELRYCPGEGKPQLSPIASLVLKSLQNHLNTIQQPTTAPRHMLRFVSEAWDLVLDLEEETRMLELCGVTKLKLLEVADRPALRARCTLLGATTSKASKKASTNNTSGNQRIDIDFAVRTCVLQKHEDEDGEDIGAREIGVMDLETDVIASKVYGFGTGNKTGISEDQMRDIICTEIGDKKSGVQLGNGVWSRAVRMLTGTVF